MLSCIRTKACTMYCPSVAVKVVTCSRNHVVRLPLCKTKELIHHPVFICKYICNHIHIRSCNNLLLGGDSTLCTLDLTYVYMCQKRDLYRYGFLSASEYSTQTWMCWYVYCRLLVLQYLLSIQIYHCLKGKPYTLSLLITCIFTLSL